MSISCDRTEVIPIIIALKLYTNWETRDSKVTYITDDRVVHSYNLLRTSDTMSNIRVSFPESIPVDTTVELFYCEQLIESTHEVHTDEHGDYLMLLPKMNTQYNIIISYRDLITLKVSHPRTSKVSEPIIKHLAYYYDTPERRYLAQGSPYDKPVIDIETIPR